MLVGVGALRPGVAARFARRRRRVEAPFFLAGLGVQRGQAAADPVLAAGAADVDLAVVVERALVIEKPERGLTTEVDQTTLPVSWSSATWAPFSWETKTMPSPRATPRLSNRSRRLRRAGRAAGAVRSPEGPAGGGVEGEDVVGTVGDVERAFVLQRLALGGELRRGGSEPILVIQTPFSSLTFSVLIRQASRSDRWSCRRRWRSSCRRRVHTVVGAELRRRGDRAQSVRARRHRAAAAPHPATTKPAKIAPKRKSTKVPRRLPPSTSLYRRLHEARLEPRSQERNRVYNCGAAASLRATDGGRPRARWRGGDHA